MGSAAALPCLLLCILYLTAGASAKPHYMVLFPSVLYYPYTGKVLVHLMDLDEPVRVTLHLASSHGVPNVTLEEQGSDILQLNWPHFSNISTPPAGVYEVAHLHVSIQGGSLQVSEQKKVLVKGLELGTLVQTDKDVYKPGQTVKFRILRLDQNFIPINRELPLVAVQDPSGNRIAQWREVSPRQGIVDLSLPLAAEAALGTYTIEVEGKRHSFSVKDYGLPHFEVLIQLPCVVTVKDEKIPLDVCGWYPSGKAFRGRAEVRLCQLYEAIILMKGSTGICTEFSGQTGRNGCFSTQVPVASFNLTSFYNRRWLHAYASLLEEGTGKWRAVSKTCRIVYEKPTITFENTDKFYKPGIPYTGMVQMLLKATNGSALRGKELLLVVNAEGETQNKTLLTDELGRAAFELDTSGWNNKVSLQAELKDDPSASEHEDKEYLQYQSATRYLYPFSSDSRSFLKILRVQKKLPCGQPQQLGVDYFFDEKAMRIKLQSLDVVFLVLAKGTIASVLRRELPAEAGLRGSFSLELPIGPELAPTAKVLGYVVLPNGEMVADSTELQVAKCFPNKVKIAFSEDRALPSSALRLELEAAPGSLCAVRAVDRSVLLLKPEAELSVEAVYKILPEFDYPRSIHDPSRCSDFFWDYSEFDVPINPFVPRWQDLFRPSRRHRLPPLSWRNSQMDTYKLFQNAALKLFTNAKTSDVCRTFRSPGMPGYNRARGVKGLLDTSFLRGIDVPDVTNRALPDVMNRVVPEVTASAIPVVAAQEEPLAPRTYFPETWLWDLVPLGEGGSAEVTVTVPDAVTEWEAGMFCTAPLGFGLAPATTLTAFKPFFVDLALPYAVVRHETFTLVATVFNYLRQCLQVQVTLAESAELEVSVSVDEVYRGCVCADEERTFRWSVRATSLGEVNVTVIAKALRSEKLCGTKMPVVPTQGRVATETKLLVVQPPGPM